MNWLKNQINKSLSYFDLRNQTQKYPPALTLIVAGLILFIMLFLNVKQGGQP